MSEQESSDMFHKFPGSHAWRSIRHRPFLRNLFSGTLLCLCIYLLHQMYFWRVTKNSPIATEGDTVDLPSHVWEQSAAQVRQAYLHAYHGYERFAAPHDELRPLTNAYSDKFNGWGVSTFDSLDTMLIMDLHDEFERALLIVERTDFSLPEKHFAPYFETVIRYLGGLLSAYAISKNKVLLDRAEDLATKLDPVFKTTSGLALYGVNPTSGEVVGPEIGILAEMASLQLEYTYLAKLTGNKKYFSRANNLLQILGAANLRNTSGMFPIAWNLSTGQPHDTHLSVGAQADSAHEYLLKQYLLTAKTDKASLVMYLRATTHIISNLLYLSPTRHLLYVTDKANGNPGHITHLFEHLSCFLPGLLALGVQTLPLDDLDSLGITLDDINVDGLFGDAGRNHQVLTGFGLRNMHLWAAEGIAQTCWLTYADQPTGLAPDEVVMKTLEGKKTWDAKGSQWRTSSNSFLWMDAMKAWKRNGGRGPPPGVGDKKSVVYTNKGPQGKREPERDYSVKKAEYLLRPETVESLYILWRVTGDPKWRVRGRNIFQAIEKEAKTPTGYASLKSVKASPATLDDDMPSYFLAETLKYLYLMFIDEDPIPLDKWVFNTEAHPFPVFEWTPSERELFGI